MLNEKVFNTGTVSGFQQDLVEFSFSNNYTGGLLSDFGSLNYVYFFTHDNLGMAFAHGVMQQNATGLPNANSTDFGGTWSGFGFDFFDSGATPERFSLSNISISGPPLNISGFDEDGNELTGTLTLRDTGEHGHFDGVVYIGTSVDEVRNTIWYGFMSPDKNVIGFMFWPEGEDYAGVWSVVLLTRQP